MPPAHAAYAQSDRATQRAATAPDEPSVPRWYSQELLQRSPVAEIAHDGQIYRLRRTALGKLILTK